MLERLQGCKGTKLGGKLKHMEFCASDKVTWFTAADPNRRTQKMPTPREDEGMRAQSAPLLHASYFEIIVI